MTITRGGLLEVGIARLLKLAWTRTGFRMLAYAACPIIACTGCTLLSPKRDAKAVTDSIETREILLVDEFGKPWLAIGPDCAGGVKGIAFLSPAGLPVIVLGLLPPPIDSIPNSDPSGLDTNAVPALRLESPGGMGSVTIVAFNDSASIGVSTGEQQSANIFVKENQVGISFARDDLGGADKSGHASTPTAPLSLLFSLDPTGMTLTVTDEKGATRQTDLREFFP